MAGLLSGRMYEVCMNHFVLESYYSQDLPDKKKNSFHSPCKKSGLNFYKLNPVTFLAPTLGRVHRFLGISTLQHYCT